MSVGTLLAPYHTTTKSLSDAVLANITELVYSYREGTETVCAVTEDLDTFESMVGTVPDVIRNTQTYRYAVDLESLGTNKVRMYTDSPETGESLLGYYIDSDGDITEKKIYKKQVGGGLMIDRYDATDTLIASDQPEAQCDRSGWTGREWLADKVEEIAEANNFAVIYLRKGNKNQCYIRVAAR